MRQPSGRLLGPGSLSVLREGYSPREIGILVRSAAQVARAREAQAHAIAEMALEEAVNAKDAGLARLAFDARRWFAGKMMPRTYGDRPEPQAEPTDNSMVLLLRQMRASSTIMPVQIVDGTARDLVGEERHDEAGAIHVTPRAQGVASAADPS